jgi:hypothetical protein
MNERPELSTLRYVSPAAFGPQHLELLDRLVAADTFAGLTTRNLAARIAIGDLWMFETAPETGHAIVLLSTAERDGNPAGVLMIEGLAGDNVLRRREYIVEDVCLIASFYGAGLITALSARGFEQFAEGVGFAPVATLWQMEVDDGRSAETDDDYAEG